VDDNDDDDEEDGDDDDADQTDAVVDSLAHEAGVWGLRAAARATRRVQDNMLVVFQGMGWLWHQLCSCLRFFSRRASET
jgi:hypothetical protein